MMDDGLMTTQSVPAADFSAVPTGIITSATQILPIKIPNSEREDFIVHVRASVLYKCRRKLREIRDAGVPPSEALLAIGTLCIGTSIGAWQNGVDLKDDRALFFYVILPVVAAISLVAYYYCRRMSIVNAGEIAKEILSDLPDPDRSSVLGQQS